MPAEANAKPNLGPSGRDLRFDSFRGLMLVSMTINHLPSAARLFTDEPLGIFSSAEGFVFLSGLLAGWVYTRRLRREGEAGLRNAAVHRATMIWRWQVAGFLACLGAILALCWITGFCSWSSPPLFYAHPWLSVLLGCTMLYQPGLLDILPMYCFFVLLLPPVLRALERGRYGRVLAWSALPWFIAQWIPPVDGAPLYPIHVGSFNIFAWQFLFVAGVAIGHARISRPNFGMMRFRPLALAGALGVGVFGFCLQRLHWHPPIPDFLFGILLNKPNLGAFRLLNFGVAAYCFGLIGGYFPRLVTWRPLAFLGQHSLVVVAAQSVAVSMVIQFDSLFATPWLNWLTTAFAVAFLFAAAAAHQRFARATTRDRGPFQPRQAASLGVSRPHEVRAA
ncbi:MAG TPA: OpgC domain-containing protein [Opitutaceae bacterium]|nr:OpgC domain-containing protein [Opitutaceae bacterium]